MLLLNNLFEKQLSFTHFFWDSVKPSKDSNWASIAVLSQLVHTSKMLKLES